MFQIKVGGYRRADPAMTLAMTLTYILKTAQIHRERRHESVTDFTFSMEDQNGGTLVPLVTSRHNKMANYTHNEVVDILITLGETLRGDFAELGVGDPETGIGSSSIYGS
ncbi:hypothetical protein TSAR_005542 [Trichomalopsis sarcophagae]|uniref:Uncharacterized protein n=1 Tax=Trichomalopsis sarcophagae TaxID=543379 RepID=A0A232FIC6_9HYME|nr:hypothetical protein TSAR_005542 [Trichomalopsis sarcophagae]